MQGIHPAEARKWATVTNSRRPEMMMFGLALKHRLEPGIHFLHNLGRVAVVQQCPCIRMGGFWSKTGDSTPEYFDKHGWQTKISRNCCGPKTPPTLAPIENVWQILKIAVEQKP